MPKISDIITLLSISYYLTPFKSRSSNINVILAGGILHILTLLWENYVTEIVPDPYLDEVFHIPQAQAYCNGRFDVWDSKLTTPPGLYILASLKALLFQKFTKISCDAHALRSVNGVALLTTFLYACRCRVQITHSYKDAIHTAFNIALFPPLFFFSGLFYTDVVSLCSVLIAYKLVLDRKRSIGNHNTLSLLIAGIISLTIRQTNIFWTTIFLGTLDLVKALELEEIQNRSNIQSEIPQKYSHDRLYDIPLSHANPSDYVYFAFKLIYTVLKKPVFVVKRIWPFVTLVTLFIGFVLWNGGVVLGDKSNHVAMIHLPQMLYIWPFVTFFSAPLIIPIGVEILCNLKILFQESSKIFFFKTWGYILVALITSILIVKYNTIIHPFILADNRHYMFYIFRYSILRHPKIRFCLAPVYITCSYLVYLILCMRTKRKQNFESSDQKKAGQVNANVFPRFSQYEGPKLSIALILLITTTLSLISCPLVETRYFIIPWVLWRLNVPLIYPQPHAIKINAAGNHSGMKDKNFKIVDYVLWLETLWFLLLNLGTGYIFLYRGFEWPQEPERVQRFMW